MPTTLRWEVRSWRIAPAALGLSADPAVMAERAFQIGRQGSFIEQIGTQIGF